MTLNNLRRILREAGVEFYIKKQKGDLVKVHVLVEEDSNAAK